jgi:hypothetical protein
VKFAEDIGVKYYQNNSIGIIKTRVTRDCDDEDTPMSEPVLKPQYETDLNDVVEMIQFFFKELLKFKDDFRSTDMLPMNFFYHTICNEEDDISRDISLNAD